MNRYKFVDISKIKSFYFSDGYISCKRPSFHPSKNYSLSLHRILIENKLGRYLDDTEVVHHKDGNSLNNSLENLELFSCNAEHLRLGHSSRRKIKYSNIWNEKYMMESYVKDKKSIEQIAEENKCSQTAVKNALVKIGIPLRQYTVTAKVKKKRKTSLVSPTGMIKKLISFGNIDIDYISKQSDKLNISFSEMVRRIVEFYKNKTKGGGCG